MENDEKNISKEKQQLIIEAAKKRFAHYGYSKVTMDEIAADVDMAKASIYYYFPTKESVFTSVIKEEQDEAARELEAIISKNIACKEKLVEYVRVRLNLFQKLVNLGTLSIHTFNDPKIIFKKLFVAFEEKELKFIQEIIRDGIKSGEFRDDLDKETASVILHVVQGLRFRVLKHHRGISIEPGIIKELQNEMNLAIGFIINGILK